MTDQSMIALAENFGAEVGRYEGKAVWIKFHSSTDLEAFAAALVRKELYAAHEDAQGLLRLLDGEKS